MKKNILIRCDGSKDIGLGHVIRCLVLAKGFKKKGHSVYFATRDYQIGIDKIKEEKFPVILPYKNLNYNDWLLKIANNKAIDIFIGDVRDGLPPKTIKTLKKQGILTVAIDEPSDYAKECDICFYPPHANIDEKLYKGEVFQGFEYVILRDEFYKNYQKIKNQIPNILVMMGGTDANDLTLPIVKHLLSLKQNFDISVVVKKEHKDYNIIKNISPRVKVYFDIKNMAKFLTKVDFGIISFGMSAYELLTMQIPAIHICLDEDHWIASNYFEKNGYAKRYKKESIKDITYLDLDKKINFLSQNNKIIDVILNYDKYFISIGAGNAQTPLIKEIKKVGYKAISTDLDNECKGKKISDIFLNISTYEAHKTIEELKNKKMNINGVLTRATGEPTVTVAKIAKEFNLRALDIENATIFSNKSLLMKKLNSLNIPSPVTITVKNNSIENIKINFPVFVKPAKTVASHTAMSLCNNNYELKKAIKDAVKVSETKEANIEEYLLGRDMVSIDFVYNKEILHIATIGELSSGEPNFDGIGWYVASNDYEKLAKQTFQIMKEKLNIQNGFLQTAMKINLDKNIAKIYEVHAEIGGDKVNDVFIPYLYDYNIFEENINFAVNKKPKIPQIKPKIAIMIFKDKVQQYKIELNNYILYKDVYIKKFDNFKQLEIELKNLENNGICIDNQGLKI